MQDIYEAEFVEKLFDNMSASYDRMNYITSFGFSSLWRRQCIKKTNIAKAHTIVDLMTGMGECWKPISELAPKNSRIIALDFSGEMIKHAEKRIHKFPNHRVETLKQNLFSNTIDDGIADCVVSGFGMKTFSTQQLEGLAKEIERILKSEGEFSLIDVSIPQSKFIRSFYMFYLKKIIPILGRVFLGNPETYRMLGVYTDKFGNSKEVFEIFKKYNFEVRYHNYFLGCASGISGRKKAREVLH